MSLVEILKMYIKSLGVCLQCHCFCTCKQSRMSCISHALLLHIRPYHTALARIRTPTATKHFPLDWFVSARNICLLCSHLCYTYVTEIIKYSSGTIVLYCKSEHIPSHQVSCLYMTHSSSLSLPLSLSLTHTRNSLNKDS